MVGEQLQRYGIDDWSDRSVDRRNRDQVQGVFVGYTDIVLGEHVKLAAARLDLLQIGLEFFNQLVVRGDRNNRHLVVDQGQRAVLELTGRVGLGVDVGDLLELERTLHGDRVLVTAAEKQGVVLVGEVRRQVLDGVIELEHSLHALRQAL